MRMMATLHSKLLLKNQQLLTTMWLRTTETHIYIYIPLGLHVHRLLGNQGKVSCSFSGILSGTLRFAAP